MSTAKGIGRSSGQTLSVQLLKKPMIVRFTAPFDNPEWELLVKAENLLDALREEGVLPKDDGTRERLEALVAKMEMIAPATLQATVKELREVLDPTPPFEFPRGIGAVVDGVYKGSAVRFVQVRPGTWYVGSNDETAEHWIRKFVSNLVVIHEGMVVDTADTEPTEDDIPEG